MQIHFFSSNLVQSIARFFVWTLCLLSFPNLFAQDYWKNLIGDNLSNWEQLNGSAIYELEDGVISGTFVTNSPNSFLASKEHYGDFILEYEMIIPEGVNSGVQIRSHSKPEYNKGRVHGYQVECAGNDFGFSGGVYDEARRGWLYHTANNHEARAAFKVGSWNQYRVEAIGSRIRTWVNGVPAADFVDNMDSEGFVALQVHSISRNSPHAGLKVKWRNIRIRTEKLKEISWPEDPDHPQISYLDNELTPKEKYEGWQLLWDGKTTHGWRSAKQDQFPEKGWQIENGELTSLAGGGGLLTKKTFKNFILEVDFRITKGANSGIKYFVDPDLIKENGTVIGCEFQIIDDRDNPDLKKGGHPSQTLGSLYDLIPANGRLADPTINLVKDFRGVDKWNRVRIEVRGKKVAHYLNGWKIVEYERGTQQWKALVSHSKYAKWPNFGEVEAGHILLQDHGDEVSFKNIKIKELSTLEQKF